MKRIQVVIIACFVLVLGTLWAQIPSPSTPRLLNEKGYISDDNPLPVEMVTSGQDESVLASETIGLMTELGAIKAALASETAIVAAIETVETAIQALDNDTTIVQETIGLMTELEAIKAALASETAIVAAIETVETAIQALDNDTTIVQETIGLMTELGAIKAALASETAIVNAVGSVKTAVEGLGDVVLTGENIGLVTELANIKNSTASETVLISELTDVSNEVYINKVALSANTDTTINTGLSGRRVFIEIRGDKEFWINTDAAAVIGNHWRVVGGVGLRINEDCQVHVIASEAVNLFVLEGGRK